MRKGISWIVAFLFCLGLDVVADDKYEVLSPHYRGWILLCKGLNDPGIETWVDGDRGAPATEAEKKEAYKEYKKKYELRCWRACEAPLAEIMPLKEVAKKETKQ